MHSVERCDALQKFVGELDLPMSSGVYAVLSGTPTAKAHSLSGMWTGSALALEPFASLHHRGAINASH